MEFLTESMDSSDRSNNFDLGEGGKQLIFMSFVDGVGLGYTLIYGFVSV